MFQEIQTIIKRTSKASDQECRVRPIIAYLQQEPKRNSICNIKLNQVNQAEYAYLQIELLKQFDA